MDLKQLARKDLNLLVTLLVLLEERSVTAAADKLVLTQPAISKALGRLRELFNDPLFTRTSRGLIPTPFALSLQVPLKELLHSVSGMFLQDAFDPATYSGKFIIAVNEFMDLTLMPVLASEVSRQAPGVVLESRSQTSHQLEGLEKGELDAVINLMYADMGDSFDKDLLFSDGPGLFARSGHPLLDMRNPGLDAIRKYARVELQLPDMEYYALSSQTSSQKGMAESWPAAYVTNNMISALAVVARTDYLLPGPYILSGFASANLDFKPVQTNFMPPISIEYFLMMHQRVENSAAHQWLRGLIKQVATGWLPLTGVKKPGMKKTSTKKPEPKKTGNKRK